MRPDQVTRANRESVFMQTDRKTASESQSFLVVSGRFLQNKQTRISKVKVWGPKTACAKNFRNPLLIIKLFVCLSSAVVTSVVRGSRVATEFVLVNGDIFSSRAARRFCGCVNERGGDSHRRSRRNLLEGLSFAALPQVAQM